VLLLVAMTFCGASDPTGQVTSKDRVSFVDSLLLEIVPGMVDGSSDATSLLVG
jgi:hypothetical protein